MAWLETIHSKRKHVLLAAILLFVVTLGLHFLESDFNFSLEQLEDLIRKYGYVAIITLTVAGNIGIPVPEETVTILAGYAASQGWLSYPLVWITCIISALIGDGGGYYIGLRGGRQLVLRYGKHLGIREEQLIRCEVFFVRHGALTVFLARFVAGLRFLSGPMCGISKMPFARFITFNFAGALVWSGLMTFVGYRLGPKVLQILEKMNWVVALVAVFAVGLFLLWRKRRNRQVATSQGV